MKKLYEEPIFDVTKVFFEDLLAESGNPESNVNENGADTSDAFGS